MGSNPFYVTTKRVLNKLGGDRKTTNMLWDGNTEGRDTVIYSDATFYKVSDRILSTEELTRSMFTVVNKDGSKNVFPAELENIFDSTVLGLPAGLFVGFAPAAYGLLVISGKAFDAGGFSIPSDGTYFFLHPQVGFYLHMLSFETIVPIDQKYLPGTTKVFKLQDYGIDLVTMVLGGQTKVEQDNSVLITAVNNAVSAGMIPMVILHEMMPAHCFVNYAYVNGEIGFSGYLRDGEIVSRIDVAITNGAVFVFPTVLGA